MPSTKPRRDIHAELTDRIVEAIEQGAGDFQLPWHRMAVRPTHAVTGHRYRGVNILSLWIAAEARGYDTGLWATYRQWSQAGAQVRRGEKATPVVFYKAFEVDTKDADGEPTKETCLFARPFRVFNADQVDGFEIPAPEVADPAERLEHAEALVASTGADIRYGGQQAYYNPAGDYIRIPERSRFTGTATRSATEAYYGVLFHELTHWTGHPARCDRDLSGRFGEDAYAMEELVAELGAAFLSSDYGISSAPRSDHAAYLASWLPCSRTTRSRLHGREQGLGRRRLPRRRRRIAGPAGPAGPVPHASGPARPTPERPPTLPVTPSRPVLRSLAASLLPRVGFLFFG